MDAQHEPLTAAPRPFEDLFLASTLLCEGSISRKPKDKRTRAMLVTEKQEEVYGGHWDRLLAVASNGLDFPPRAPRMAGQREAFHERHHSRVRELTSSETDSEAAGILASIAVSSPPITAASPPSSNEAPNLAAPSNNINNNNNVAPPDYQKRPQPRKPTTKHAPKLTGKASRPSAKGRRKPATTTGAPGTRARSTRQTTLKQESKPSDETLETVEENVTPSADNGSKPQTRLSAVPDTGIPRCCPPEVPGLMLALLDSPARPDAGLMRPFAPYYSQLCIPHLQRFAQLMAAYAFASETQTGADPTPECLPASQPEQCMKSDSSPPPKKRLRDGGCDSPYYECVVSGNSHGHAPILDVARDEAYRQGVMRELEKKLEKKKLSSHGDRADHLIYTVLKNCKSPTSDEAYLLSGEEAAVRVEAGLVNCPIFTTGQQQFQWNLKERPIAQLFRRMEDLNRCVSVQIPSRKTHLTSHKKQKLSDVHKRFLESYELGTDDPWNILDLQNPLPPAVLPQFLTGENCQLLLRVRDSVLSGSTAERTVAPSDKWTEWVEILDWVLMSEGGHNTAPHTDSHGLATWITIQEGDFGYGWLSKPIEAERQAWIDNPDEFVGGQWRFTVLTPGQTVFFNSGTPHFVFRLRREQTLALGGHLLLWSDIAPWISLVQDQLRNPAVTNEDMEWSAPRFIRVIADLVQNRIKSGRIDELGGRARVDKFLNLMKEFEKNKKPPLKAAKAASKAAPKKNQKL